MEHPLAVNSQDHNPRVPPTEGEMHKSQKQAGFIIGGTCERIARGPRFFCTSEDAGFKTRRGLPEDGGFLEVGDQ